jgi:hypothetical protein
MAGIWQGYGRDVVGGRNFGKIGRGRVFFTKKMIGGI